MDKEIEIATVINYNPETGSASIEVTKDTIKIGDVLHFKGKSTDLLLEVSAMKIKGISVKTAQHGDGILIRVPECVETKDKVFKILSVL